MATDTELLKSQLDLPEFIMAHVGPLKRVSGSDGGIWRGPCPKCGGRDRFTVKGRGMKGHGVWACNQCHTRWADAFDFLAWWQGTSFKEAAGIIAHFAGLGTVPTVAGIAPRPAVPTGPQHIEEPSPEWRERAEAFVARAETQLWRYPALLERLKRTRGLEPETVRVWGLGYNMERWIFPARYGGRLQYIKTRASVDGAEGRWGSLAGGKEGGVPYGADLCQGHDTLVVVEGHGDALLLWQALRGVADVVTLGSATATPSIEADRLFRSYKHLLAAHDADEAGDAAASRLIEAYGAERLRPPVHKDWLDTWRAGYDLPAVVVEANFTVI